MTIRTINYEEAVELEEYEERAIELAQEKTKDRDDIEVNTLAIVNGLDDYDTEYVCVPANILIHKTEIKTPLWLATHTHV